MILPVHGMILEHLGYPLDIGRNLGVFDYTQIADLLNNHGEALGIIFYQAKWILFFYLLVSVLLTSGMIHHFSAGETSFSFSKFIRKALVSFWKYLRLTIYFLFLQAALLALALFLYQLFIGGFSPFEIEDESRLVSGFWTIAPVYLFVAFSLQIVSDIAKFNIAMNEEIYIHSSILRAFKTFVKHFFSFLLFYLIHVLIFLLLSKLYLVIKSLFNLESNFGFWVLIIAGQLYIFFKVGLRLVKYAGLNSLKSSHKLQA